MLAVIPPAVDFDNEHIHPCRDITLHHMSTPSRLVSSSGPQKNKLKVIKMVMEILRLIVLAHGVAKTGNSFCWVASYARPLDVLHVRQSSKLALPASWARRHPKGNQKESFIGVCPPSIFCSCCSSHVGSSSRRSREIHAKGEIISNKISSCTHRSSRQGR